MLANDGAGADLAVVGGACVVAVATVPVATSSNDTGPILAFVGVLLVAFLTAYFARRRLDKQLRAEAERHEATLAAERERLALQLRHERHLDHIDAMRTVLIDVAEHLERFQFRMSRLKRDPAQPSVGAFDPGGEFERTLEEYRVIGTRLRLFFPRDSDVVGAFGQVTMRAFENWNAHRPGLDEARRQTTQGQLEAAHERFEDAARREIGAEASDE